MINVFVCSDLDEETDSQGLTSSQKIPDRKPSQRRDGSDAWKVGNAGFPQALEIVENLEDH